MELSLRHVIPDSDDFRYVSELYDLAFPKAEQERMENIIKVSENTQFGELSLVMEVHRSDGDNVRAVFCRLHHVGHPYHEQPYQGIMGVRGEAGQAHRPSGEGDRRDMVTSEREKTLEKVFMAFSR
ncbi:MAG: hypothetical protein IJ248_00855 [Candidatus Methanomethylophilaceae archaeon]|nr:hypothetical protein [Candidatus Methanomethylophilaceae archaeon]